MSKQDFMQQAAMEVMGRSDFTIRAGEVCIEEGPDLVPVDGSIQSQIDAKAQELSDIPIVRRVGSSREFLRLFTIEERMNIKAAADPIIDDWILLATSGDFSLDHPDTAAGLGYLVINNIISQSRADEILATNFDA